jgi:hypothetical protein
VELPYKKTKNKKQKETAAIINLLKDTIFKHQFYVNEAFLVSSARSGRVE